MKGYYPEIAVKGIGIEVFSIKKAKAAIERLSRDTQAFNSMREKLPEVSKRFFAELDAAEIIRRTVLEEPLLS